MIPKLTPLAAGVTLLWLAFAGHFNGKVSGYLLSNGLTRNGENVCEKDVSRTVSYQTKKTKLGHTTYKTRCPDKWNWFGWRKCTAKKTVTKYYQVVAYRQEKGKQLYCCEGWTKNRNNQCLTPVCSQKCIINQGICIAPNTCRCIAGWTGDSCSIDVNECKSKNGNCEQTCTNIEGSYECHCRSGYQKVDKFKCEDIDECKTNSHSCHEYANCTNTAGSFNCTCHAGYLGNGVTCVGKNTATTSPTSKAAINVSAVFQSQVSDDAHEELTTLPPSTPAESSIEPTTLSTSAQSETSVTFLCSGYNPGSDEAEKTELLSTVLKASSWNEASKVTSETSTNQKSSPPFLTSNDHGFMVTLFVSEVENNKMPQHNITGFTAIFQNSTINCTLARAFERDVRHDADNKVGGTMLNWQTPVACTAGVALFILLAVLLVILRAKRTSNWITIVHAPYVYQPFPGNGNRTGNSDEDRKFSKVPLLESEDEYDLRTDDMA